MLRLPGTTGSNSSRILRALLLQWLMIWRGLFTFFFKVQVNKFPVYTKSLYYLSGLVGQRWVCYHKGKRGKDLKCTMGETF